MAAQVLKLDLDTARRLALSVMRDPDPRWIARASRFELEAFLTNYAASLPAVS